MCKIIYFNSFFGHLSLALTGLGKDKNLYVSFYQRTSESPVQFRLQNLFQDGIFRHNALDPNHDPDVYKIIWIPTEEFCGYGLSEAAMYDYWSQFKPKNIFYALLTHNCSSMVHELLRVGQAQSVTLNHEVLPLTCMIERPSVISDYAEALRENIIGRLKKDEQGFARLLEWHVQSQLPNANPYSTLYAWAIRLREFNKNNPFSEIVNKPFCHFIKKTLRHFRKELLMTGWHEKDPMMGALITINDLPPVDLELHLLKIIKLADYVSSAFHRGRLLQADRLLQNCLQAILFKRWRVFMNYLAKPSMMDKQTINEELAVIRKKVVDDNNPHANLYFSSPSHKLMPRLS